MKKQAEPARDATVQVMAIVIFFALLWAVDHLDAMDVTAVAVGAALAALPFWLARHPAAVIILLLAGILIAL